jgi:hypothetical protein
MEAANTGRRMEDFDLGELSVRAGAQLEVVEEPFRQ